MADEQEAIAPAALETASEPVAIETTTTPEPVDEPINLDAPELEATGELTAEEEETIEVDWDDGKKYKIPKALEGGLLKNKDYTQGKQSIAETRRALEAEKAALEERYKATDEELDARADLRTVTKTLEQYAALTPEDWQAHEAADPAATNAAWRQYQMLKDQKAELENKVSQAQAARTGAAEQGLATRIQETLDHAQKSIPGWKPDTIPKLVEFAATELKIPDEAIKANWSPTFVNLLYRAQIGDQLLKKQATAPKLPPSAPNQPLKTVGGKSTPAARGDLASIDNMEEYVAARKSGVGGKGGLAGYR